MENSNKLLTVDIYNSEEALKLALKNYWEIDRLCSGRNTQHDSTISADYIHLFVDLKSAIKALPQVYKFIIFNHYLRGIIQSEVAEAMNGVYEGNWTQQKVEATGRQAIEIIQANLQSINGRRDA